VADLFSSVHSLQGVLDYHLQRHNLLISNVTNVDTPGYIPKDLKRVEGADSFANALQVSMSRTSPGHMAGAPNATPTTGQVFEDPSAGAGNDKNAVSLDREAAKVAANNVRYDVVTTLVTAELGDLSFAASDGRSGG
jgi:flagellar basal-body rod protein FlgB